MQQELFQDTDVTGEGGIECPDRAKTREGFLEEVRLKQVLKTMQEMLGQGRKGTAWAKAGNSGVSMGAQRAPSEPRPHPEPSCVGGSRQAHQHGGVGCALGAAQTSAWCSAGAPGAAHSPPGPWVHRPPGTKRISAPPHTSHPTAARPDRGVNTLSVIWDVTCLPACPLPSGSHSEGGTLPSPSLV